MKKVNITHGKQLVLAGDFNLFFDSNLETKRGKPILKKICCENDRVKGRIWFMWYLEN